jgi:hypothetical protein
VKRNAHRTSCSHGANSKPSHAARIKNACDSSASILPHLLREVNKPTRGLPPPMRNQSARFPKTTRSTRSRVVEPVNPCILRGILVDREGEGNVAVFLLGLLIIDRSSEERSVLVGWTIEYNQGTASDYLSRYQILAVRSHRPQTSMSTYLLPLKYGR